MSFLFSSFHMIKYPSPIRNGISPNDHAPPSQSLTAASQTIRPRPTMVHTTPRRTSERLRTERAASTNNSAGTDYPFSTNIRIVHCQLRLTMIENMPIKITIRTGAPNIDRKTIPTSGIISRGISSPPL